jgi:hypothetical protein
MAIRFKRFREEKQLENIEKTPLGNVFLQWRMGALISGQPQVDDLDSPIVAFVYSVAGKARKCCSEAKFNFSVSAASAPVPR